MDYEEGKEKVVTSLQKKKGKTKFYFNDLAKMLGEKPRAAKKIVNQMILEEVLEYWSSGSRERITSGFKYKTDRKPATGKPTAFPPGSEQ